MKYKSKNRLFDFEFHDSFAKIKKYENHNLSLFIDALNLHKDADQNEEGVCDLELGRAIISFEKLKIETVELVVDQNNDVNTEQTIGLAESLLRYLAKGGTILHLKTLLPGCIEILIDFRENGWYRAELFYDDVCVEWDEFLCPAWYERGPKRQF